MTSPTPVSRELPPGLGDATTLIAVVDREGTMVLVNRAIEELTGKTAEELRRLLFAEVFLSPDDRDRTLGAFHRLRSQGAHESFESDWPDPEGGTRRIVWVWEVLRKAGVDAPHLICTGTPVPDRRRAKVPPGEREKETQPRTSRDRAVHLSETWLRGIISLASDAVVSVNEAQEIVFFNRGAEKLFGYDEGEVLGRPLELLLPGVFAGSGGGGTGGLPGGGAAPLIPEVSRAVVGRGRDGEEVPADAAFFKIEAEGEPIYTLIFRAMSPRVRARAAERFLAEVGEVLNSSLEVDDTLRSIAHLAVGFFADFCVVDLLDDHGTVRRLEIAHADPMDQTLARNFRDIQLDRDLPRLMRRVLRTGEPELIEGVDDEVLEALARSDEHLATLRDLRARSFLVVPLLARQHPIGTILFATRRACCAYDGIDLELARELARRAGLAVDNAILHQSAQDALAARDEVLSAVSHDLGNQLQAVSMILQQLEGAAPSGQVDPAATLVPAAQRSVEFMTRLLNQLLEASRAEAGPLPLRRRRCSVESLVAETMSILEPVARVRSVEVRVDLEVRGDGSLPHVDVDRDRVVQVLSNLVGNGIRHTPAGGMVTIRARSREGEVQLSVTDTGSGIPPEDLGRIFDRFWRGELEEGSSMGVGLGLAIARGIVRSHGGTIWAESDVGAGSRFHFTLPVGATFDLEASGASARYELQ